MYGWSGRFAGMGMPCPGDPGCPGNPDGYPVAGIDYDPALLGGATVFPQEDIGPIGYPTSGGNTPYTPLTSAQSATQFLNVNAGKIALGVGGFFALMLFAKAGR